MAVAVTDWAEGNPRSAKKEAERALQALLQGKLGLGDGDTGDRNEDGGSGGALRTRKTELDKNRGSGERIGTFPVPLGLCVSAAAMLLLASLTESRLTAAAGR